ncbi:MAG: hypothetical protein ACYC8T_01385 [Myxococcaceae bacterium]
MKSSAPKAPLGWRLVLGFFTLAGLSSMPSCNCYGTVVVSYCESDQDCSGPGTNGTCVRQSPSSSYCAYPDEPPVDAGPGDGGDAGTGDGGTGDGG